MRSRNPPTLDDNDRWRSRLKGHWLKHERSINCYGARYRCGKVLVVRLAQWRDMVADHQDKFFAQPCQRTALQSMAGTTQQLKRAICRALVGMFGPFEPTQADRPVRFRFQLSIQQLFLR